MWADMLPAIFLKPSTKQRISFDIAVHGISAYLQKLEGEFQWNFFLIIGDCCSYNLV